MSIEVRQCVRLCIVCSRIRCTYAAHTLHIRIVCRVRHCVRVNIFDYEVVKILM